MWHNSRRGFNLIRSRANARNSKLKKVELTCIATFILLISAFAVYGTYKVASNSKIKEVSNNLEENASVEIYKDDIIEKASEEENVKEIEEEIKVEEITNEEEKEDTNSDIMKITAFGEIMMGGAKWTSNSYSLAFKEIASHAVESDYTIASLATNITSVEDLTDTKSKYITNDSIVNAFSALNIDALNIATDHMLDFSKNMFNTTVELLKKNNIKVIGLEEDIVYAEKNGIRVAIIGINNVVIGNASDYIDAGMYIYDLGRLKNSIKEARTKADTIIVMTHYGKENVHEITDVMRWFAREIVKAGADMVLGGHSLGIYPIEEYNGKIIIYSLGYLMHDTNKEYGKKSAIFDFNINIDGKIEEITITPTYIQNKNKVKLFRDINVKKSNLFLEEIKNNSELQSYTSIIENDKLQFKLIK